MLLVAYDLTGRNASTADVRDFTRRLLERARALPAVESAAIAASVPLDIYGLPMRSFTVEGRARPCADQYGYAPLLRHDGIAIRTGSDFADLGDESAPETGDRQR